MRDDVHVRCEGRWPSILMALGLSPTYLKNRHGPCPMCGGTDRWLFKDWNGTGSWWCNSCGHGNGVDFVMAFKNCNFVECVKLIEGVIGGSRLSVRRPSDGAMDITEQKNAMRRTWLRSLELNGRDVASRYLKGRSLVLPQWPPCLRWVVELPYWLDREKLGYFPAMLARFVAPDEQSANILRTYLIEPGRKADVPEARKMMAGPVPYGGAVRLAPAAEVMGVAEGIETALAASILHGMPVWATLSTAGLLRFQPPAACKKLLIFADKDEQFAGEAAATALAHRLMTAKLRIEADVKVPDHDAPVRVKTDWNDVLSRPRAPGLRVVK
jgi:putative DNA primase/helicase